MKRIGMFFYLITASCLLFTPPLRAKIQLRYANFFPPTHIQSQLAESWCQAVEKRTNGEVVIQYYPAGTLTKAPQTYDGVVHGIADIGMTVLAYSRGRFPVASAIDLPLGYTSGVQATALANAVLNQFNPKEFKDTQIMFLHAHGPGFIHTRDTAVHTLKDLKGLKIRSTGTSGQLQKALGASPVGKSMKTCYQMLQRGIVDGSAHPMESNKGWKLGEVVHYMVQNYATAYTTTFAVFMNKRKWAKLTPEQQTIISKINLEWAAKHGKAWDDSDREGLALFKEKGGRVIPQSAAEAKKWVAAAAPVINKYIKKAAQKGLDGQAIVNFIKSRL
ncbi:MAG: C4-dicarboxylate ABC transporter substrate-binding protein [Desulfobacterales bacterium]|nr:MAG: C4-dicarboxylate ABC transporter substrate-binding protein [Desulfobacterales bacterium]